MKVKIKKLRPDAKLPVRGSEKAAGMDLYAMIDEPIQVRPGRTVMIPTGVAMHLDTPHYAGFIYARSGLGAKKGLVPGNLVGVIDADYQGEIMVAAWNRNQGNRNVLTIEPGDRIAQLVIGRVQQIEWEEVEAFEESARGANGFGSTGVRDVAA